MKILFEAPDFMAVDKPAGVLSQKDKSGEPDLAELMKKELAKKGKPLGFLAPAHRLDRNTSGLILLAKSPEGARKLTGWIRDGRMGKTYLAIVKGDPGEAGQYDFALEKDSETNQVFVSEDGAEALTSFKRVQFLGNSSLVEVTLHTGRSHQIRAHFAAAGHALLGDKKYAKKPWSEIFGRPALHAWRLELPPEAGLKGALEAPLPEDFRSLLLKLGGRV
ncbi:MAG: RNA pseudouridine synthase [Proteobacteria bacterium]|nr:MAG: RNA pseudouridine synthase [Pseudomonadota bacterium]